MKNKESIEEYQCPGCIRGSNVSCFEKNPVAGIGCGKHSAGTFMIPIGKIFLGMPKGFNRLGPYADLKPLIFETFESAGWSYNMWNIPVWKYKNEKGHTMVRGLIPRRNEPFLHIYLEDCLDKIDCLEISQKGLDHMD